MKGASILCCLSLLLWASCNREERNVEISFYHWQTRLGLTETEQQYLGQLAADKLYVKFFDVDWEETTAQAVPLATLQIDSFLPDNLQIIPTVFITNSVLKNLMGKDIDSLSERIHRKILQLAEKLPNRSISEIQMDCDWSQSTRDRYFQLLRQLHRRLQGQHILLSVTIRLHQIPYREQTGVPPADRGILMCYNTGEVMDWQEENSILSAQTTAPYLSRLRDYPLSLDLALPIFAWGVLFRDGRMIRLINGLRTHDLEDTTRFSRLSDHRFEVIKSTYLNGYYLYQHDRLRLESISYELLQENVALLAPRWPTSQFRLVFYHLDSTTIQHFPYEQLERIRQHMRQR